MHIVIDDCGKTQLALVDTRTDSLILKKKNIKSIWVRTLNDLHTKYLDISDNPLIFLPYIYTLKVLKCANCGLRELPTYLPQLEELDCSGNPINYIPKYPKLKKITSTDCPLLTIHDDPQLYKRSGVVIKGKFTWVSNNTLETKYSVIDWQNAKCKISFDNPLTQKVAKFLFYS